MTARILCGDALTELRALPDASARCCITSPPYWGLRDYGMPGQLGLEASPAEYVEKMVEVFREVRRVLTDDGTLWCNLGDSYAANRSYQVTDSKHVDVGNNGASRVPVGLKAKDLVGIPWMVAFALRADGWYLRSDIIWAKPNPMPESVTDRPTKSHEYLFLLSKRERYYYDAAAIAEDAINAGQAFSYSTPAKVARAIGRPQSGNEKMGAPPVVVGTTRNARSVWTISTKPFSGARLGVHGGGDGNGRITSEDCPLHGDQRTRESMGRDDESLAASRSARSHGNGDGHAQVQPTEPDSIQMHLGADYAPDSLGSPDPECEQTATEHSMRTRRTVLAPLTSQRERCAEESVNHTDGTAPGPDSAARFVHNAESRTAEDFDAGGTERDRAEQTEPDNAGTCTCRKSKAHVDHFAVFPEELARRCILAGSAPGDTVLDPFGGSGTVGQVATGNGRSAILIELNPAYAELAVQRIGPMLCTLRGAA